MGSYYNRIIMPPSQWCFATKRNITHSILEMSKILKLVEKNLKFKIYFENMYITFGVKNKLAPSSRIS